MGGGESARAPFPSRFTVGTYRIVIHEPTGDSVVAPASAHVGSIRGAGETGKRRGRALSTPFPSPFRAPQLSGIFILDSTESWARKGGEGGTDGGRARTPHPLQPLTVKIRLQHVYE